MIVCVRGIDKFFSIDDDDDITGAAHVDATPVQASVLAQANVPAQATVPIQAEAPAQAVMPP